MLSYKFGISFLLYKSRGLVERLYLFTLYALRLV
nr:MAG TPA: hypothetical protein [Caudoviricetes sp.]